MAFKIIPIILAGGVGTRLWPLSRETYPKQFLRLLTQHSLLQETALRLQLLPQVSPPFLVCNIDHYFISQDHLKEINANGFQYILEPFGKNTAPAIACAAQYILDQNGGDDESIILVLPSDHYIADLNLFCEAIDRAQKIAEQGYLVTFGVTPTAPETGYGYIKAGHAITPKAFKIERFIEKPALILAREFLDIGDFYWNSGMFMFKPQVYLEELAKFSPEVHRCALEAVRSAEKKDDYIRINAEKFEKSPNISIDYAVMEKTQRAALIPLASSWNDLGCWAAVAKSGPSDSEKNVIRGEVLVKDSEDCFVSAQGQMVAILGLKNQIVVTTPDVVLVANKAYSQDVKHLVNQLKSHNSDLVVHHRKQSNAAGYAEDLASGDFFKVEHFMLKPYTQLDFLSCGYPAHWIVVSGSGELIIGNNFYSLTLNNSLYVPENSKCHVKNHTEHTLHLIRVQLKMNLTLTSQFSGIEQEAQVI